MTRPPRKPKSTQPFKKRRKRPCVFCVNKNILDYKDIGFVRRFVSNRGKIVSRRFSGCCALHQRMVAKAVKRARQIGLVPYTAD